MASAQRPLAGGVGPASLGDPHRRDSRYRRCRDLLLPRVRYRHRGHHLGRSALGVGRTGGMCGVSIASTGPGADSADSRQRCRSAAPDDRGPSRVDVTGQRSSPALAPQPESAGGLGRRGSRTPPPGPPSSSSLTSSGSTLTSRSKRRRSVPSSSSGPRSSYEDSFTARRYAVGPRTASRRCTYRPGHRGKMQ